MEILGIKEQVIANIRRKLITVVDNEWQRKYSVEPLLNKQVSTHKSYLNHDVVFLEDEYQQECVKYPNIDKAKFVEIRPSSYSSITLEQRDLETLIRLNNCLLDKPLVDIKEETIKEEMINYLTKHQYWQQPFDKNIYTIENYELHSYRTNGQKKYEIILSRIDTFNIHDFGKRLSTSIRVDADKYKTLHPCSQQQVDEIFNTRINKEIARHQEDIIYHEKQIKYLQSLIKI